MKIAGCEFPDDLLYEVESDVWGRQEGPNLRIGIDSILSWLTGGITAVRFKPDLEVVSRGMALGSIEGPKHFAVIRSPVTGELLETNLALASIPRTANHDPYGKAWFALVRPSGPAGELESLKRVGEAKEQLEQKMADLHVHCFAEFPDQEMFEIGTECSAVLTSLDELLAKSETGTVVHIVSDDKTAELEMVRWSEQTGNELLETRNEKGIFHFIVRKR